MQQLQQQLQQHAKVIQEQAKVIQEQAKVNQEQAEFITEQVKVNLRLETAVAQQQPKRVDDELGISKCVSSVSLQKAFGSLLTVWSLKSSTLSSVSFFCSVKTHVSDSVTFFATRSTTPTVDSVGNEVIPFDEVHANSGDG